MSIKLNIILGCCLFLVACVLATVGGAAYAYYQNKDTIDDIRRTVVFAKALIHQAASLPAKTARVEEKATAAVHEARFVGRKVEAGLQKAWKSL